MESSSYDSDTAGHPEVPETHRLVLGARGDHPAAPRVQRQDVTWTAAQHSAHTVSIARSLSDPRATCLCGGRRQPVCTRVSAECVQTLSPLAIGGVDVTVSSSGADQDGSSALWTLHEGQVPDGAVMHAELQVRA